MMFVYGGPGLLDLSSLCGRSRMAGDASNVYRAIIMDSYRQGQVDGLETFAEALSHISSMLDARSAEIVTLLLRTTIKAARDKI